MSNAMQNVANTATGLTAVGGTGSATYAYLTSHAPIIALSLTAISLLIALTFYVLNYRINCKRLVLAMKDGGAGMRDLSDRDIKEVRRLLDRRRTDCDTCEKKGPPPAKPPAGRKR